MNRFMTAGARVAVCSIVLLMTSGGVLQAQSQAKAGTVRQAYKGWPAGTVPGQEAKDVNLRENFVNPPKGYGNVPFYWWSGDTLRLDRLREQLDILSDASTDGLCVSYCHTNWRCDTLENAQGHGPCGRVSGGSPRVFSEQWRSIWNDFSADCADRGIGLGMDDYVVAWPKNGEFIDSILQSPAVKSYQGRLKRRIIHKDAAKPATTVLSRAYGEDSCEVIWTEPSPELFPDYGKLVIDNYFQPFYDSMDEQGRKGMNYFFQDELMYYIGLDSWSEDMREQFLSRKGYDIVPHLDAIFAKTPDEEQIKYRLDYAQVLTELSEERYFKPIYEWNASKGLIYGCDNMGRGLYPLQYLDYFRAVSWFTAPGNDAPARGSSFTQTKVSSSIAHLYNRPRTWLEAFHSMGWDANGGVLTRQLDHHLIAGGNLLCMHGLYYSTHGSWWEWAPPCFHFRMPYWPHMKRLLKYAERMCYVLSQGEHVCDIAILYPTETMQAIPGTNPDRMFSVSADLSNHGLDYDFIDWQSLQKARISAGGINISGESYKVLILADIKALHEETRKAINDFIRQGGLVYAVGDTDFDGAVKVEAQALVSTIRSAIVPDFGTLSSEGKVLHRHIGDEDLYMLMDVKPGDEMSFRTTGRAEVWDAMHGTINPLEIIKADGSVTTARYTGTQGNSLLVVFTPGEPVYESVTHKDSKENITRLTGEWDIEIIPTMDNSRGDFRLPASKGCIGVEAREMSCNGRTEVYGYGPYMKLKTLPADRDLWAYLESDFKSDGWEPYSFSWQYGVFDSPGSQGYHGLKSKVDDRFLILDKGGHQIFQTTVYAPSDGVYDIVTRGKKADYVLIDRKFTTDDSINLSAGPHDLTIAYSNTPKANYALRKMVSNTVDTRQRGMVVLYPHGSKGPSVQNPYGDIVASGWFATDHLVYDATQQGCVRTYTFRTAPGTRKMEMKVNGKILEMKVDGKALTPRDGLISLGKGSQHPVKVEIKAIPDCGCPGSVFFAEPVRMECRGGKMEEGDWTEEGAMKFFSGGVRYTKTVILHKAGSAVLDLGDVDATCEVSINGQFVDVLLGKPYSLDISSYVKEGENTIEVLVYSSLANHWQTVPSPYKGTARAGLIGPVNIRTKR